MVDYRQKLSDESKLPESKYLKAISQKPEIRWESILDKNSNRYLSVLRGEGLNLLATGLATPGLETRLSKLLAERFNENLDKYDAAIDAHFNKTGIGGSILHHNLDGSHTFQGAMNALRTSFPDDTEWHLRLQALEHLARDFTTPSGINPFLEPEKFLKAKEFLEDLGISSRLVNDLLNFNASELGLGLTFSGLLVLGPSSKNSVALSRQVGRLATTQFFSGNIVGMILAAGILLRIVASEEVPPTQIFTEVIKGGGEILLAAALLPSLPLSVSFIVGSGMCALTRYWFEGSYNVAIEMEKMFSLQFPKYRSYLSQL